MIDPQCLEQFLTHTRFSTVYQISAYMLGAEDAGGEQHVPQPRGVWSLVGEAEISLIKCGEC